ncbi:kinase phosphorylation protein-domain-containing protein [Coniella lustricola]|uniref:Kinase phosphorylation protein-domain-containing protein n=1 Tax=Coniella lustricola TaxID=2025994 RepID=A0A2T3AJQ1_9PEZI|nr:kinase phosphorylation protein-domain-containing protein [Coniella lustricola]
MDLVSTVRKQGSRGGVNFSWDQVATSAHRENYLGHSLKAPVGRWQQGKDLGWYAKADASNADPNETEEERQARIRREEIQKIKEAEEDAMAKALGLPPPVRNSSGANAIEVTGSRMGDSSDGVPGLENPPKDSKDASHRSRRRDGRDKHHGRRERHEDRREDEHRHRRRHRSRSRSRSRNGHKEERTGRNRAHDAEPRPRREHRGHRSRSRSRSPDRDRHRHHKRHEKPRSRSRERNKERGGDKIRERDDYRHRSPERHHRRRDLESGRQRRGSP